jgi:Universal stress protein family
VASIVAQARFARPATTSAAYGRASARSVFARFLRPRRAAVSAGSARRTLAPTRCSSSATNRHPVVASNATSSSRPSKRAMSAVRQFLLGSVADRVVRHATCDVLVVR